jgi:hypothetical protein
MNIDKKELMIYVESEYNHFIYNYKLLKKLYGDENRDKSKDNPLLFGVLITSWGTYYRSLYDFFNEKNQQDDIRLDKIIPLETISFNHKNAKLKKHYDTLLSEKSKLNDNEVKTLEGIKKIINKLISHNTETRISVHKNGYDWEIELCTKYIFLVYNALLVELKKTDVNIDYSDIKTHNLPKKTVTISVRKNSNVNNISAMALVSRS